MFEVNTSRQTYPKRIRRITAGLALVLVTVSALSLVSVIRADDPPLPDPDATEVAGIMIDYFVEVPIGVDQWLVEGIVEANDLSAVSIQFGGCASGTIAPDTFGYFSIITTAQPDDTITADATDGVNTAHVEILFSGAPPETI